MLSVKGSEMTNNDSVCNDGLAAFAADLGSRAPSPMILS